MESTEEHEDEGSTTLSDEEIASRPLDATPDASADDTDDSGDVTDVSDAGDDSGDDSDDTGDDSA